MLKRITSYYLRQKNIFKRTEKSAETWKYPVVHYIYDSFVRLIYSYSNYSFIHLNEINQKKRKILKRTEKSAETKKYPLVHHIYDRFLHLI